MKARTRKRRKPSPLLRSLLIAVLLILAGAGIYYLLSLPIWKIQEVTVNGAKMLSAEDIRDLSGIPLGENLFLTSFARSRDNLRKITAIKSFHFYRIPPATVLISIQEREPIAVIVLKGKSAVVDAAGYIMNRNPNLQLNIPDMAELPVISGIDSREVSGGERIEPKVSELISEIIIELAKLLGSRQIQLETGGFEKISIKLNDLLWIKIGRAENVREKMAVFKKLLPVIADKWSQVDYVDVRYPDNPVVKYK